MAKILEKEIDQPEKELFECVKAVEQDEALRREMQEWNTILQMDYMSVKYLVYNFSEIAF